MNIIMGILLFLAVGCSRLAAESPKPAPVYVYLFALYEDHINVDLSEWRIMEVMRVLSDPHRAHPDSIAAVGEFYGADSEMFQQRNRESGIVDLIRRAGGEGWYDVGYHGALYNARASRPTTGRSANCRAVGPPPRRRSNRSSESESR